MICHFLRMSSRRNTWRMPKKRKSLGWRESKEAPTEHNQEMGRTRSCGPRFAPTELGLPSENLKPGLQVTLRQAKRRRSRRMPRPSSFFMQEMGLEPTRHCCHRHLKPARLPIPPLLRTKTTIQKYRAQVNKNFSDSAILANPRSLHRILANPRSLHRIPVFPSPSCLIQPECL